MRLSSSLLGLVANVLVAEASFSNDYNLPDNHMLWGAMGRPKDLNVVKRDTNTTLSAYNTTESADSYDGTTSTKPADPSCIHGPRSRACWSKGFNLATDFDTKWPTTGKIKRFNLHITNTTCDPDGNGDTLCMLINNQLPGPTLIADWGDEIHVTVHNKLQYNGTSFHWHGVRQLNTPHYDGVNGITECPIAPGSSRTYKFQATQYGTSWYHSHFSAQYGNGLVGALVINGPAASNYDIDLGSYTISDWYYATAFQIEAISFANLQHGQGPPPADNILINGTNENADGGGQYDTVMLKKGKRHRLRLINTSLDNQIRVSLDGHPFTVIASDFIPVRTFTTNWLLLGIGQRYDVIIHANATAGNYWFRAEVAPECASANNFYGRSIFTYEGTTIDDPTSSAATIESGCNDAGPLVPWWPTTVPSSDFKSQARNLEVDLTVEQVTTNGQNVVFWGINLTAIDINWSKPTLQYVADGNTSYPRTYNLIELPISNIWTYWIIQETPGTQVPIPHPIHLHGHDFFILGKGVGTFDTETDAASLNYVNPPRRDVTFLPGQGWAVLAFPTDNPGAWLMHCHIAWHISQGLGVQFLESKGKIAKPDLAWQQNCARWDKYERHGDHPYNQTDSGL